MARAKRSRRTLTTLVVLVLISVSVITLDESGRAHSLISGTKSVARDVFSPIRSGVNSVLDPVGQFFAGAVDYGSVQQENAKLRAQVGQLRQQLATSGFNRRQLVELQQLLRANHLPSLAGLTTVPAQVTSISTSNFAVTVTIGKGRDAGVAVGDPVEGAGGLIGVVVEASHSTATVRLVTDGRSRVGVSYGNGQFATLVGQGRGKVLSAQFVAAATAIHVGQTMVTDGLTGALFPAGLPVATVSSVRTEPGAAGKVVTARPLADLDGLGYVTVVQWSPPP